MQGNMQLHVSCAPSSPEAATYIMYAIILTTILYIRVIIMITTMIDNGLASIVCLISKFIYTFMSFYEHEGSKTHWSMHATH